ncbi:MAG: hypothetical protein ABFS56_12860 [Pseudomonadota bacterium]
MNKMRVCIVLLMTVLGGGCAATNCNPTGGGFYNGVACLWNDGYKDRIRRRTGELGKLKRTNRQSKKQQEELKVEIEGLKAQVAALSNDTDNLVVQVEQIQSEDVSVRQKVAGLSEDIKRVRGKIARLKQQQTAAGIRQTEELKKQAKALEKEVEELWDIYNSL